MLDRDRLKQYVLFPPVLLCAALLVLGAVREEIRPDFLNQPSSLARRALYRVGITHGMAVFSSQSDEAGQTRIIRARCLEVLASSGDGPLERIYPDGGGCAPSGVGFQIRPEEILLSRLLMFATADEAERRMENTPPPPPGSATAAQLMLPSVAHYFAQREELKGRPRDRLLFLLSHYTVTLDGTPDFVVPVLVMDVSFAQGPSRVQWFPTREQAARLWPEDLPR